jgi:hypothetical protein
MINKFLHALTNRKTLSTGLLFASDPGFVPMSLSPSAADLRTVLGLDNLTTDYYLHVYAALIEAYPDIKRELNDPVTTYSVYDFLPRGVVSNGAKLLSNGASSGVFTDPIITALPVPLTYIITFVSETLCQIQQIETGTVLQAPCQLSADPQNTWLRIAWPSGVPFLGVLSLTQPWVSGAVIKLKTTPSHFPYAATVAALLNNPYFSQILQTYQLSDTFQNTIDAQDQLALALAVIAASNLSVYPS